MGAEATGKRIGIGLRLAAKAARQRAGQMSAAPIPAGVRAVPVQAASQARLRARGIAQGAKRFGGAVWGPMAHTGSVLWLEITGLFFALFAVFFGQNAYTFRADWRGGPDHIHFIIYASLAVLFSGFTVSQFYRARQKEKRNRGRRASSERRSQI